MKKILLTALALPLAFAACTNDEFASIETPNAQGDLIALSENFAIGLDNSVESRADYSIEEYEEGKLRPYFTWTEGDKIGLGWKQNNDGLIYTNYQFDAFAFGLYKDAKKEETLKAEMTLCDPYLWKNVAFFSQNDQKMGDESTTYVSSWNPITPADLTKVINNQNAFFRTCNMTIFKGDYLVYFPFDATITEAGNLIAKSAASFEVNAVIQKTEDELEAKQTNFETLFDGIADEVFNLGSASINGGTTATSFTLSPVSGIIRLQIAIDKDATKKWENINKVAVYTEDGIQLEQAVNAADLSLIADDVKETKSLFAGFDAINITQSEKEYLEVMIPALPQTIKNASVGLFDDKGNSIMISVGDIVVPRGGYAPVKITLKDTEELQSNVFYVVDMETFALAMTNAGLSSEDKNVTIKLISDIVYDETKTNNGLVEIINNMVIEGGDITIPADNNMAVQLRNKGKLTFNNNLIIEDKGCCGTNDASVTLYGEDQVKNSYAFNGDVTNDGQLIVGLETHKTVATFNGEVINNKSMTIKAVTSTDFTALTNNGTLNVAKTGGVGNYASVDELVNDGDINVSAYASLSIENALTNDGNINIASSGTGVSTSDGTVTIQSDATATNNGNINNMGVYENIGATTLNAGSEFVDYVGSQWGVNMPTLVGDAEYICEVDGSDRTNGDRLAYALGSKIKTTTVRFVGNAKHQYQLKNYASLAKLATVKYIVNVDKTVNFQFGNATTNEIVLGTSLTIESANSVEFTRGKFNVNGNIVVNAGSIYNNDEKDAIITAKDLTLNNAASLTVNALVDAKAASELTTPSWNVKNIALNGTSTITVEENAALKADGNLTIAKGAKASFAYSSYTDVTGAITNNGTFERVLSSTTGSKANPAQVWCTAYTNNGTQLNAGAQVAE